MNTLKISVKSNKDAALLMKLLKSLSFVVKVEPVPDNSAHKKNQYQQLNDLIEKMADKTLFQEITNPVRWQNNLRNEWT